MKFLFFSIPIESIELVVVSTRMHEEKKKEREIKEYNERIEQTTIIPVVGWQNHDW